MAETLEDQKTIDEVKNFVLNVGAQESAWRYDSENELDFLNSNQWPTQINPSSNADAKPTHVINMIPAFLNQIINQAKMNRPAIKVHPIGSGADVEIAKVLQGYFKHVENISAAANAYDRAIECAVQIGRGFIRYYTDYCNERSFEQDIYIGSVFNPFSVYYDPYSTCVVGSDCDEAIITEYMSTLEFDLLYPRLKTNSFMDDFVADSNSNLNDTFWLDDEKKRIRIAERFKKLLHDDRLLLFKTGKTLFESEIDDDENEKYKHIKIIDDRKAIRTEIEYTKVNGTSVLSKSVIPGKFIPIIPVYGNRNCIQGKLVYSGLIKLLQDPQYMMNFWRSKETQVVSQAPVSPWVAYAEVIEGYEQDYQTAHLRPQAVLKANAVSAADGLPGLLPLPQRVDFAGVPSGIIGASENSHKDMQAVSGIYDTALGQAGNEISGEAIDGRVNQSNIGAYHYNDNLNKTVAQGAKIIMGMVPKVIDTERMIRIILPDSTSKMVTVNERTLDPITQAVVSVKNDLSIGEYDVVLDTGPSFSTRRQESSQIILELAQVYPQIMEFGGDILLKNLDINDAQELAARAGALLPEQLQGIGEEEDMPPKVKALLGVLQQQNKQLTQELQQATDEFTKQVKLAQLNAETEITIERIKHDSSIYKTSMTNDGKKDVEEIKGMVQLLLKGMQIPHELALAANKDLKDDFNVNEQMKKTATSEVG